MFKSNTDHHINVFKKTRGILVSSSVSLNIKYHPPSPPLTTLSALKILNLAYVANF